MGYLSYGYKASKTPLGKKVVKTVKNIFTPKGKVSPTIKKVDPFVPKNKSETLARDLKRATQQRKTSEVKLANTLFKFDQGSKKFKKGKELEEKAKGGRVGLKLGTKKKSNIEKIKKTFGPKKGLGMQSVIYGLDKNPKITAADPKAKFIAAANKKKKKKII